MVDGKKKNNSKNNTKHLKRNILFVLLFFCGLLAASLFSIAKNTTKRFSLPVINSLPSNLMPEAQKVDKKLTLIFGGDLMFDRSIRQKIDQYGVNHILEDVSPVLQQADIVIANLEGPVTNFQSKSVNSAIGSSSNFIFTFDPMVTSLLKNNSITLVNLGNNHIQNFGLEGVKQTKEYLTKENIVFFGNTGTEVTPQKRVNIINHQKRKIAFVNYNQFTPSGWEAALSDMEYATTNSDLQIVYTHWGNEYVPLANAVIVEQAHTLVDAGADLIIGSHPHVVQQKEVYKDVTIYYSLGNFVFDQYFSQETKTGLLVKVEVTNDTILAAEEIPITLLPNGKTTLKQDENN